MEWSKLRHDHSTYSDRLSHNFNILYVMTTISWSTPIVFVFYGVLIVLTGNNKIYANNYIAYLSLIILFLIALINFYSDVSCYAYSTPVKCQEINQTQGLRFTEETCKKYHKKSIAFFVMYIIAYSSLVLTLVFIGLI